MKCQLYGCKQQAAVKIEQTYTDGKVTISLCEKHARSWLAGRPKTARRVGEIKGR